MLAICSPAVVIHSRDYCYHDDSPQGRFARKFSSVCTVTRVTVRTLSNFEDLAL